MFSATPLHKQISFSIASKSPFLLSCFVVKMEPAQSKEQETARSAVFVESTPDSGLLGDKVKGFDFSIRRPDGGVDFDALLGSYYTTGFQATSFGKAVEEINKMIKWRLVDDPIPEDEIPEYKDPVYRKNMRCTIFLGYTSNLISSGLRETIRYLVQNKMVDCIVSTAGGIEEDFIKCLAPTYLGDFALKGSELRMKGINRIGNLLVPNNNYGLFEDWLMPILEQMYQEQLGGQVWSPSKIINRLGKEINNPESVYYWAWKNDIPVFCPALTDGSLGDMIYMFSFKRSEFIVDLVQDIRAINSMAVAAKRSGVIVLGGGLVKHHVNNANLMRNGADHAVFVNTAQEFDGSDAGARPDESVSWGKIKMHATPVKIYAEATLVFPLLVAQTFAKHFEPKSEKKYDPFKARWI